MFFIINSIIIFCLCLLLYISYRNKNNVSSVDELFNFYTVKYNLTFKKL